MELHLEFQPHRFITRFNAIQKELEAREVIYTEDDEEEEEEEGIVEEIQEGAHVHEDPHHEEGVEGESERGQGESAVTCMRGANVKRWEDRYTSACGSFTSF